MPPIAYHAADAETLRRILAETGVATRTPSPTIAEWVGALVAATMRWVGQFFQAQPGLVRTIVWAAIVTTILAVVCALALVALAVLRRDRGARQPSSEPGPGWSESLESDAPSRDRAAWKAEIQSRLEQGDVAGALEAFWSWLAASLPLESDVDTSWTTRELLVRARRRELLGLGAALDALMYGPRAPSPQDVTLCLARFEERLL